MQSYITLYSIYSAVDVCLDNLRSEKSTSTPAVLEWTRGDIDQWTS
ncbi:hypothetical protein EV213_102153 [Aureibacillus halotolerans]|uniref:Uncharacterized protein n=1 Tax=Aureibacillus halotolerans TaxID=1508390 RepID=A0A4R6UAP2_9BACI|nr:hypothetical protein EV213_102153 [Aureibacillus halotolerans]